MGCERRVREAAKALENVVSVEADADAGTLTVHASGPINEPSLSRVLKEKGYELKNEAVSEADANGGLLGWLAHRLGL